MVGNVFALAVSTLYIVLTSLIAYWSRKYTKYYIRQPFVRALFLEGIATAELCGACFELIIIADNWGVSMYAIYLFVLTIWWSMNWEDATACPYTHIEDLVEGTKSLRDTFLLIWAELVGGLAIFRYVQLLWAMEIVSTHKNRAFEDCTTDLQVPVIVGAFIECIATCICRVVSRGLSELNPRFSSILDSFVGTTLVVAAFNYSGGYFNPALATSLKYGCLGTTFMEHVIVYWIGAIAGSVLSLRAYRLPFVQRIVNRQKEKLQ
ncbi:aquaporin-11 [Venturia canescens]|uniref:aquaporin-11 n=1 Tax=Venturia canescens TaxID=32260 RepID=UPI001C9BCE99|nr:aquaporin-11 [Venturia canescens]XP_043281315.1 aquaporin-11 [Venturia canescens]XP_043281316.1 aquaporin-11 [Venturia canescens]XP_043281318.1 aquaporin-11 [Venturia canescens]